MNFKWFLAGLGALLFITIAVLLELGVLTTPWHPTAAQELSVSTVQAPPLPPSPAPGASFATAPAASATTTPDKKKTRRTALYELTQQGLVAKQSLAAIAQSPVPGNLKNSDLRREEVALRVTALEALDKLAVEHPREIRKLLEEIALRQKDPTLKFLVRVSLDGIYAQHPGKLSRALDAMIAETAEKKVTR